MPARPARAPTPPPASARPLRRGAAVLPLLVAAALPPAEAAATPAPFSPQEEQALSGHWLVILGSKRDPAEPIPGLATLAAHPEAGVAPRTLLSSRFKNLMPCYTVTVAAAPADKAEALKVAAKLRALGVDHYVKAAGEWVGRSPGIDAWCAAPATPEAGEVRVGVVIDGTAWLYDGQPPSELSTALDGAGPPRAMTGDYDAWYQPAPDAGGAPASWRLVDATSGTSRTCTTAGRGILTLGTPHFGTLQGEKPPTAPSCGAPLLYSRLDCGGPVPEGSWVAVPAGAKAQAFTPAGELPAAADAAKAALTAETEWEEVSGQTDDVVRSVEVKRFRGPRGEVALVVGNRVEDGGLCGGDDRSWAAVYVATPGGLGQRLAGWTSLSYARVAGLVDVDGDGTPELVVETFPNTTSVLRADGAPEAEHSTGFCDCPC